MRHISELNGIGINHSCIIIGGGLSVRDFDFNSIPEDFIRFEINYPHAETRIDYQIYYDQTQLEYWKNAKTSYPDRENIAFKHWENNAEYYFDFDDIDIDPQFCDTGFYALWFCDKVFQFSNIYIIGYDYKTNGKSYHWYEEESNKDLLDRFHIHSIEKVKKVYYRHDWNNKIYNCNPNSALTLFEYKKLRSDLCQKQTG
jgi:hypothetical protein